MKLNIEELAREAGISLSGVATDAALETFARLIVERCAVTAKGAAESGWDGATIATIVRKLLEAE